jgi:hypothetical protein
MPTRRKTRRAARSLTLAQDRTLHLVDVENICGTGRLDSELVRTVRGLVAPESQLSGQHHWVVAASSSTSALALAEWPQARRVVRYGADGADLALLEVLDDEATRYSRVVVYSGDGIFSEPLACLAAAGLETTVVARPERLSARLRLSAHHVVLLASLAQSPALGLAA